MENTLKNGKRGLLRIVFSRTMLITALLIINFLYLFSVLFDLFKFVPILFGSMVIFTAAMELWILNSGDNVDVKLTWAVVVAVLPLVGAILYLFVRFDLGNRVNKRLNRASVHASLPYIPKNAEVMAHMAAEAPELLPIAGYLASHANAPAFSNTEVFYYPVGEAMFEAMLPELEKAEKYIYMEYFLVSRGHMWNTILEILTRKAAEGGAVHPLHIDSVSNNCARQIESSSSEQELLTVMREMIRKYCLLVKNHSLKGYSLLIRQVITHIDFDLTADLSLKAQAQLLNVNPSYLSTLFKKETGVTLTEYVNRRRMDHALLLLNSTGMQIQLIAQHCGIPDVNYFTKTFKKMVGQTPKKYRDMLSKPL